MNKKLIDMVNEISKSKDAIGALTILDIIKPTPKEQADIDKMLDMSRAGYNLGLTFWGYK